MHRTALESLWKQGPDSGGLAASRELDFSKEPPDRLLLLQTPRAGGAKRKFPSRRGLWAWPGLVGGALGGWAWEDMGMTVLVPAFCGQQKLGDRKVLLGI